MDWPSLNLIGPDWPSAAPENLTKIGCVSRAPAHEYGSPHSGAALFHARSCSQAMPMAAAIFFSVATRGLALAL